MSMSVFVVTNEHISKTLYYEYEVKKMIPKIAIDVITELLP